MPDVFVSDPNGSDYSPGYYERPRCVVCGRLASKRGGLWVFPCVYRSEDDTFTYTHD